MYIPDNVIRNRLKNVYFIWGRGKTTIAQKLKEKYGFYIYSTDDSRSLHVLEADTENQPYMCWNVMKEYGVKDFWALPKEVIREREEHFVQEMTPMIIADLIELSKTHEVIICEGDIDYKVVVPVVSHAVHLCNCGKKFDWFKRPDHDDVTESMKNRNDLSEEEKLAIIENAYACVSGDEVIVPDWVKEYNIKNINWDDDTSIEETTHDVEKYFNFQYMR